MPPAKTIKQHQDKYRDCALCPRHIDRSKVCLFNNPPPADILFISSSPSLTDDHYGAVCSDEKTYLDHLVFKMNTFLRTNYTFSITSLVSCFASNKPTNKEIEACQPRLREFIRLCNPLTIVLIGKDVQLDDMTLSLHRSIPYHCVIEMEHPAFLFQKAEEIGKEQIAQLVLGQLSKLINAGRRIR